MGGIPLSITFVNGILNSYESAKTSAEMISEINNGCRVDFVADPSQGAVSDLFQAAIVVTIGAIPEASRRLAALWKRLLKEMDMEAFDEEGQSQIIHYAHSRGGIVSTVAMELLTPAERERIVAHYLGSPSVNPKAIHHVSSADIVPSLSPHPIQNMLNYILGRPLQVQGEVHVYDSQEPRSHIRSVYGDHSFRGPTYRNVLEQIAICIIEGPLTPSSRRGELSPLLSKKELPLLASKEELSPFSSEEELSPFSSEEELSPFSSEEELSPFSSEESQGPLAMEDDLNEFFRS